VRLEECKSSIREVLHCRWVPQIPGQEKHSEEVTPRHTRAWLQDHLGFRYRPPADCVASRLLGPELARFPPIATFFRGWGGGSFPTRPDQSGVMYFSADEPQSSTSLLAYCTGTSKREGHKGIAMGMAARDMARAAGYDGNSYSHVPYNSPKRPGVLGSSQSSAFRACGDRPPPASQMT